MTKNPLVKHREMKRRRQVAAWITGAGLLAGWAQAGRLAEYDAAAGHPASAAEIQSPVDQGWTQAGTGSGITVEGIVDGTIPAWRISDDSSGANPSYTTALSTADLAQMFLHGWEFEMRVRAVRGQPQSGFCGWGVHAANDPGWGVSDRERVGFGINYAPGTDAFQVAPIHGGTITLGAGSVTGFHTLRCVGTPSSPQYEFFIDGASQGLFDLRDGSSNGNYDNVLRFASGSTAGTVREAAWNRVQLTSSQPLVVIIPSEGSTVVDEEGPTSDSITVYLSQVPGTSVTVTVVPRGGSPDLDLGGGPGGAVELAFSPLDWNTPQPVWVSAVDDADEELEEVVIITATAASGDTIFDGAQSTLPVTVLDNDLVDPVLKVSAAAFISPQAFNQGSYVTAPNAYHTFRIPSLIVAPDDSLLAFAEGRRGRGHDPRREGDAPIDLVMSRSMDHGVTWSAPEVVDPGHQPNGWLVDFADPTAVVDDTTEPPTLWLLYGQWPDLGPISPVPGNDPDPAATNQVVWVRSSIDNGATWSARGQILKPVGPPDSPDGLYWRHGEPGPGNGIQLRWQEGANAALNGRMVIPAKRNGSTTPSGSVSTEPFAYYSDDHGASWQVGNPTAGPDANEDEVVELSSGDILLDARQNSGSNRRRHRSSDGGVNWGANLGDDVPITAVDGSVDRYSARRDGDDRDRILFSGPAGSPAGSGSGRQNITVWTSYDEGVSFINPVQVDEGPAAYSVVRTLPHGDIGVLVETDGDDGVLYGKIEYFGFGIDFLEGMVHPCNLTHYDGFGNRIDRSRGGTGWSGPWSPGATFTDAPADEFGSAGIGFPDFDRARSFGRVDLAGAQSTARDLSRTIDLGIDDQAYVSMLVSRQLDGSPNGSVDEELRIEFRDAGRGVQAAFGIDSEESFFVDELGIRQAGPPNGLAMDTSYLLVLKIVARASGGDRLFLKAYPAGGFGSGSVESDVVWTVTGSTGESSAAVLESIALVGSAGAHWSVDELRIGATWPSVAGEDTDEDGLDDAWEITYFTTLTGSDGSGDADADGMSDAEEQAAGTDPRDPSSRFDASIRTDGEGLLLSWPSAEGRNYGIDHRSNLETGTWLAAQSGISATPPTNSFSVPSSGDRACYRIELEL